VSVAGLTLEYRVGNVPAGDDMLQRMAVAFDRAGSELEDFGAHVFPKMVPVFEAELAKQFDAEGAGPNRGSWAALSPAYEEWKGRNYPGQPILVRTGALRDALTMSEGSHALRDFGRQTFNYGTSGLPYASFHQSGTARMPDRPPFDLTVEFEMDIQRAALAGAREAIHAAGADEFISKQIAEDTAGWLT
jgi:phage gpG-like protein